MKTKLIVIGFVLVVSLIATPAYALTRDEQIDQLRTTIAQLLITVQSLLAQVLALRTNPQLPPPINPPYVPPPTDPVSGTPTATPTATSTPIVPVGSEPAPNPIPTVTILSARHSENLGSGISGIEIDLQVTGITESAFDLRRVQVTTDTGTCSTYAINGTAYRFTNLITLGTHIPMQGCTAHTITGIVGASSSQDALVHGTYFSGNDSGDFHTSDLVFGGNFPIQIAY